MAIVEKVFRCGATLDFDDADLYEKKAVEYNHINPSLEFYLQNHASSFDNALVVGAGFGLSSKLLTDAGATVTSIEPQVDRFNLLQTNVTASTNINKACSSASGTGTLDFFSDNKSGASLNTGIGNVSESVDVITVDSLNLTLDLLIVNANGKELDVIDGSSTTISNNTDMKIILKWIPDMLDDVDASVTKLQGYGKTIRIIHWEEDDSITFKTTSTEELKAVEAADLLLE